MGGVGFLELLVVSVFNRREKQSLERYLKDVPTVEEHQKLTKTISFYELLILLLEEIHQAR